MRPPWWSINVKGGGGGREGEEIKHCSSTISQTDVDFKLFMNNDVDGEEGGDGGGGGAKAIDGGVPVGVPCIGLTSPSSSSSVVRSESAGSSDLICMSVDVETPGEEFTLELLFLLLLLVVVLFVMSPTAMCCRCCC